jgi:hypothetical protein
MNKSSFEQRKTPGPKQGFVRRFAQVIEIAQAIQPQAGSLGYPASPESSRERVSGHWTVPSNQIVPDSFHFKTFAALCCAETTQSGIPAGLTAQLLQPFLATS